MPFDSITAALLEQTLAARALTQLNRTVIYPRTAVVGYEEGNFTRGETVKIRRPKRRRAQDVNPRGSGLTITEAEFFSADVTLQRLWGDGFLVYGHDPAQSVAMYINDTATQMADSIATPNDEYMYSTFRTWSATTGAVAIGKHSPFGVVAAVNADGTFKDFNNETLRAAGTVLDVNDVPPDDRFAVIGSVPKNAFLGDSIAITGFAAALNLQSGNLIQTGIPNGNFVERYGFQVAGSNTIEGQAPVADMDTAASAQAYLPAASVADNTDFTYADYTASTTIGALTFTLTATTALNVAAGGVAVGQIAKIMSADGSAIIGFMVILRIADAGTTAPKLVGVPYAPNGTKLSGSDIPANARISIPEIPSVNTAHHREALLMATRQIQSPSPNSGARMTSQRDPRTNLLLQILTGQYDISHVREEQAYYMLTGTAFSDARKGCLMLSL